MATIEDRAMSNESSTWHLREPFFCGFYVVSPCACACSSNVSPNRFSIPIGSCSHYARGRCKFGISCTKCHVKDCRNLFNHSPWTTGWEWTERACDMNHGAWLMASNRCFTDVSNMMNEYVSELIQSISEDCSWVVSDSFREF